jgi:hypothetical protein
MGRRGVKYKGRNDTKAGRMTLKEAKKIVQSCYPDSYLDKHDTGTINNKTGEVLVIMSGWFTLASFQRPNYHPLPLNTCVTLVWKQAAYRITNQMMRKLES